jgi:Phosphoglycerate dehydrogenase and related dehydrogenases
MKESDFITIHSPLTPETENMFSAEQFRIMKKDAVIVNTARGGIIDEDALYQALKDGEIRAAGLDATVMEPPYDSPLCTLENCILTPHAGAATKEASIKMSHMAAQNALDILRGGTCAYSV